MKPIYFNGEKNLNLDIYVHFSITDSTIKDAYKNTKVHKYAIFKIKKKLRLSNFATASLRNFTPFNFVIQKTLQAFRIQKIQDIINLRYLKYIKFLLMNFRFMAFSG